MLLISNDHYHYWSMGVVSHSQWLSDLDLLLSISCPHVSLHCFLLGLTQTTSFLTLSESLREANVHSLKMFSSEIFLILLLFLSDSLEGKIYRPFLWCFLWHLKLFSLVFPATLWLVIALLLGVNWSAFPALWQSFQLSLIFHSPCYRVRFKGHP